MCTLIKHGDILKKCILVLHIDRNLKKKSKNYLKNYKQSYFPKYGTRVGIPWGNVCRRQPNKSDNIMKNSCTTYTSHKLCYQCMLETFESNIKTRYQQCFGFPWFENIHCYNNLQERLQDRSKEKQFIEPLNTSYYERRIMLNVEKTNVKRHYMINDIVKGIDTKGLVSHWPWEYPKFSRDHKILTQWKGVKRFHDLMWDMNKVYKKTTKNFINKHIDFTYQS